ncbi:MAG: HNH endonuclease [Candidatus Bathyarchaeia archaeon]
MFCKENVEQGAPVEHIWPESFGGSRLATAPEGSVCTSCNNYFSYEVERAALESFPFKFVRTLFGIPTKKRKLSYQENALGKFVGQPGGRFLYLDPSSKEDLSRMKPGDTFQLKLKTDPEDPIAVCRLLLKMGIELLAKMNLPEAFLAAYDSAREFARAPKRGSEWSFALTMDSDAFLKSFQKGINAIEDFGASMQILDHFGNAFILMEILGFKLLSPLVQNIAAEPLINESDLRVYKVVV